MVCLNTHLAYSNACVSQTAIICNVCKPTCSSLFFMCCCFLYLWSSFFLTKHSKTTISMSLLAAFQTACKQYATTNHTPMDLGVKRKAAVLTCMDSRLCPELCVGGGSVCWGECVQKGVWVGGSVCMLLAAHGWHCEVGGCHSSVCMCVQVKVCGNVLQASC